MSIDKQIRIELLSKENFRLDSLDHYLRKQDVKRVYRKEDGEYRLVDCPYTEDWDMEKRRAVARDISGTDYITYLALEGDRVVGFIGLVKKLNGPYMILDLMQVSAEFRGQGIGRKLFDKGKEEARKAGAEKLYISACSSEETIAFYYAMGCRLTDSPIKEIAEDEPYDLQMICPVNSESGGRKMLLGYKDLPIEIKKQIIEVVDIWKKHMQGDLVGVYLHGSICLNAFEPKSGDIDILVVVARSLTTEEKLDIVRDIIAIDGQPCPLEMSAITVADAKNWKNHGNCVFHYSDYWTEKYEKRFANPEEEVYVVDHEFPDADVTSYIKLLNQCGIVLYGQSIEETFDQVSDEDFWLAISNEIDDYEFDAYNERYLASNILILGRILSFKIKKRILSKYEAGLWMAEQIPGHLKDVARKAMAVWYQDETCEFEPDKLQELRDYLVEEIKR